MKIFLSRWTDSGAISIAQGEDGHFHLVWKDTSIAHEPSVHDVMRRASNGPLYWPCDETPIRPFGQVRRWSDWRVSSAALSGPDRASA